MTMGDMSRGRTLRFCRFKRSTKWFFLLPVLFLLLLGGCDNFILSAILDGESGQPITISPSSLILPTNEQAIFTATGGLPPYSFAVFSGGGTITPETSIYTAPASAGTAIVRVTDAFGAFQETEIIIIAASVSLGISPASINISVGNSFDFDAIGGEPPYAFSITSAGSGTPTINGSTGLYTAGATPGTDTVQVTDSDTPAATSIATITVTTVSPPPNIDYTVTAVNNTGGTTAGGAVAGNFTVQNGGTDNGSQTVNWTAYVSADTVLGGGDFVIDTGTTGSLNAGVSSGLIAFTGAWPTTPASYYLIVQVSAGDDVNTGNNDSASAGVPVTGPPPPDVNYTVPTVTWSTGTTAGQTVTGNFDIDNVGADDGTALVYWSVYASLNNVWDVGDALVATGNTTAMTAAEAAKNVTFSGSWPATPGNYYLVARVSATDDATVDEGATAVTQTITAPAPADVDYTVPTVTWSTGTTAGQTVTANFDIDNVGADDGTALVYWSVYASLNNVWDVGDALVATGNTTAMTAAEAAKNVTFSGSWPNDPDDYYLVARATASDDATTAENATAVPQTVSAPDVNYTVVAVTPAGPIAVTAGAVINESFDIDNTGTYDGTQLIYWNVYVSNNTTIDVNDTLVATGNTTAMTAAEAAKTITVNTGNWPASAGGPYYLLVEIAATDDADPSVASNTGSSAQVTIDPPDVDYIVLSLTNTNDPAIGGSAINETFTVRNQGADDGSATVYWTAYISTDATLDDPGDTPIDSGTTLALNSLTTSAAISIDNGTWPTVVASTTYYLFVDVSATDENPTKTVNNNLNKSFTINVPDIDYTVTAVNNTGGTTAGEAVAGNFTVQNGGGDNGSQTVYWTAYVSTDAVLGGDTVLDSGTTASLNATSSSGLIAFTGAWPTTPATYYLIVEVSAGDDINAANNDTASGGVPVTAPDIDYIVESVTITINPATGGSSINETFTVRNQGADDGSATVYWTAYISTDATLDDPGDTPVDSGTTLALNSLTTSAAISIDNGTWPTVSGSTTYYLFVDVSATDENPAKTVNNNLNASCTINVPDIDYVVTSVTNGNTPADISTAISETFTYKNQGADNGSSDVLWIAYSSTNQILDAGDQVIDSGTNTALAGGVTSGAIPINGTWSASSGVYYLIVKLSAGDETNSLNNYDTSASFTINAPADIDYIITNITTNYLTVTTDSPISETFDMTNAGGVGGAQTVSWTAYASTDTVLGGDTEVGSGTTGFLAAGASASAIPILGTWPGTPGSYYLFVEVSAADETITGNNDAYSGAFTVDDPPDYEISLATMPSAGEVSTGFNGDFTIKETLGFPGKMTIQWAVYLSTDQGLGGDILVQSGTHAALQGLGETIINFSGNWPANTGEYYLLINIDADDDSNAGNDLYVSDKYEIFIVEIESNDDFGPTNNPLSPVHDVGVLDLGELIIIKGTMDASVGYDTFKFEIGAGVITVFTYATWSTGIDDIDLFIWDENNFNGSSLKIGPDREPLSGNYGVTGWTAGEFGYVGVKFIDASVGQPYYVRIMCE